MPALSTPWSPVWYPDLTVHPEAPFPSDHRSLSEKVSSQPAPGAENSDVVRKWDLVVAILWNSPFFPSYREVLGKNTLSQIWVYGLSQQYYKVLSTR